MRGWFWVLRFKYFVRFTKIKKPSHLRSKKSKWKQTFSFMFKLAALQCHSHLLLLYGKPLNISDPNFSSVCRSLYNLYRNLHTFCLFLKTNNSYSYTGPYSFLASESLLFLLLCPFTQVSKDVDINPSENLYWYTQCSIFTLLYPILQSSETFLNHSNSIAFVKLKLVSLFIFSSLYPWSLYCLYGKC